MFFADFGVPIIFFKNLKTASSILDSRGTFCQFLRLLVFKCGKSLLRGGCPLNRTIQAYSVITGPVRNIGGLDKGQLFHFMSFFFFWLEKEGKVWWNNCKWRIISDDYKVGQGLFFVFFYIDEGQFVYSHSNLPILKY